MGYSVMKFETLRLGEVLDIQWGDTNKTKSSYVQEGFLAYSAAGPDGFLPTYDYSQKGVVLSAIGAKCGVTYFATGKWSCIKNTIRILPKSPAIDIDFFFYLSSNPNFWPKRGSAQPFISQTDVRLMEIEFPPIEVQRFIAKTCRDLDEKIRINLEVAQTLETIAEAIFKSWFVDFDPVHAKSQGQNPVGIDEETAALFPDSFEESEHGAIPAGWAQGAFSDLAEVKFGAAFKSNLFSDKKDGRPVIRIRDLTKGFSETYTSEVHPKEHVTTQGDLLIGMDGTFDAVVWLGPESLVNQRIAVVCPRVFTSQLFLKFAIQKELKHLEVNATGTTVGHLSKGEIESLRVVRTSIELMERYRDLVTPLLRLMAYLATQNRTLEKIRESFLPRLISGELEIPKELLGE